MIKLKKINLVCLCLFGCSLGFGVATQASEFSVEIETPLSQGVDQSNYGKRLTIASARIKENDPLLSVAQNKCGSPILPPDVIVPDPKVPRFNVNAEYSRHVIAKGEVFSKLIANVRPEGTKDILTDEQILAAIVRANPSAFANTGPVADKEIIVPSIERMKLESTETGRQIYAYTASAKLTKYNLPPLTYPWEEEDKIINQKKEEKALRDQKAEEIVASYEKCVAKVEKDEQAKIDKQMADIKKREEEAKAKELEATTEADLSEFMIEDPKEEKPANPSGPTEKIVNGKRVIVFTDESKRGKDKQNANASSNGEDVRTGSGSNVVGSSIVLTNNGTVGRNSKGEDIDRLDRNSASRGSSGISIDDLKLALADIKNSNPEEIKELKQKLEVIEKKVDRLNGKIDVLLQKSNVTYTPPADGLDNEGGLFSSILFNIIFFGAIAFMILTYAVFYVNRRYILKSSLVKNPFMKWLLNHRIFVVIKIFLKSLRKTIRESMEKIDRSEQEGEIKMKADEEKDAKLSKNEILTKKASSHNTSSTSSTATNATVAQSSATSTTAAEPRTSQQQNSSATASSTTTSVATDSHATATNSSTSSNSSRTSTTEIDDEEFYKESFVEIEKSPIVPTQIGEIAVPVAHVKETMDDGISVSSENPDPISVYEEPVTFKEKE